MTTKEAAKRIDTRCTTMLHDMHIHMMVLDHRTNYGEDEFQCEPIEGYGRSWFKASRLDWPRQVLLTDSGIDATEVGVTEQSTKWDR